VGFPAVMPASFTATLPTVYIMYVLRTVFRHHLLFCPEPLKRFLRPLLFNIVIGNLCNVSKYSRCLLFAEDVNIPPVIVADNDCTLMQSRIDCIHGRCTANLMQLIMATTRVVTFTGTTDLNMCILYNQRDTTYTMFFIIIISVLHVSGGFSAHHQELMKLYVGIAMLSCCLPLVWMDWNLLMINRPKHVER
jgi:hypothetical protein